MFDNLGTGILIIVALLLVLAVSLEAGFRLGRRAAEKGEAAGGGQIGAAQGAVLGLLGLLLGFSFAGAASRFIERQDLIVQEANAIGTAYLRADLLDEPYAGQMRQVLAQYVQHRLEASKSLSQGLRPETAGEVADFHAKLWSAARDGVVAKPAAILAVLDPVNQVIDLHSTRVAAGHKHLPILIVALLIVCSMLAMALMGYGCGVSGKRHLQVHGTLLILITAALWVTIDLDHPRAGFMRLSDAPLESLGLK